jgi:hypothetical protein
MEAEADNRRRTDAAPPRGRISATPASTIEALLYALRRGLSCLDDPANRDRLRSCDDAAMKEVVTRLRSWKSRNVDWLRPWADEDIAKLIKVWRTLKGEKRDG